MRLTAVRELVERPAPFLTVHAEVGRPTEDARQQLEARWTTIRHRLEAEGLGQDLIDDIGGRLRQPPPGPGEARRTIVVAGGEAAFEEALPGSVQQPEEVDVALLPREQTHGQGVAALLRWDAAASGPGREEV